MSKPLQLIRDRARRLIHLKACLLKKGRGFNCWQSKDISKKKFANITTDPSSTIYLLVSQYGAQLQIFDTSTRNPYNKRAALWNISTGNICPNISQTAKGPKGGRGELKPITGMVISPGTRWTGAERKQASCFPLPLEARSGKINSFQDSGSQVSDLVFFK